MSIKIVKKLLMLITVFAIIDTISIPVYAKDSVSCSGNFYTSPTKKNEQVRYITEVVAEQMLHSHYRLALEQHMDMALRL